jgi:HTH-type transcriptional regulator, transcriptional repressor of NAD biosynthesis genes
MMCISGAASFTGVLCVVLTTKGKITCFFWGAINSLLYGLFAYAYGYAGDAQLNLFFFFPVQFLGVYLWGEDMMVDFDRDGDGQFSSTKSDDSQNTSGFIAVPMHDNNDNSDQAIESLTVASRKLSLWQWSIALFVTFGIAIGFYYEIPVFAVRISGVYYFEGMLAPRVIDAACNALSMVAQVLCLYQFSEQWYLWLAVDALQISMYTGIAGYGIVINVVVMWCLFTLNALAGLYAWHFRGLDTNKSADETISQNAIEEGHMRTVSIIDIKSDLNNPECTSCRDPFAFGNASKGFNPPLDGHTPSTASTTRRGLIIGKFWPFHRGHEYLCRTAISNCDELFIVVCDRPTHSPNGILRSNWICESIPSASVMVIRDVYDSNDSELWAKLAIAWCGKANFHPDVVFTSETYGDAWANFLKCEHFLVDLPRATIDISGTIIRQNPLLCWDFLTPSGKEYFAKRIVIVGSESTGKSTLAMHLAALNGTNCVTEYGRELCERKLTETKLIIKDIPEYIWTDDDFEEILRTQAQREAEAARSCPRGFIICDTNIFATAVWYKRYMNRTFPSHLQNIFNELYVKPCLYLLLTVNGSVFVQDGFRDGEHIRDEMEEMFLAALTAQEVPFVKICGSFEERTKAVEMLLDSKYPTLRSGAEPSAT